MNVKKRETLTGSKAGSWRGKVLEEQSVESGNADL